MLMISPLHHPLFEGKWRHWHLHSVPWIPSLVSILIYRKCCWVLCGTEGRDSLHTWISEICNLFHTPNMLEPWLTQMDTFVVGEHFGKIIQRVLKINASTKSLVERLCDFKIYAISVLSFIGSVCAPEKATLKAENHALHCTTAGPYNAFPSTFLGVGSVCGVGPDLVGILFHLYRVCSMLDHAEPRPWKYQYDSSTQWHSFLLSLPFKDFLVPSWPSALLMTVMTHLTKSHKTNSKKLPLACFWANFINKTLLGFHLVVHRESWDRSVVIVLLTSCTTWKLFCVLLVLGYSLVSFASYAMGSALHRDFTLKNMITHAVLDAQMNLTLSHTTFWFLSGDMLRYCHKEIIFFTTWSLVSSYKAFNMELRYWASLMLLSLPIISIAKIQRHVNFSDCMKGRIRCVTAITVACSQAY